MGVRGVVLAAGLGIGLAAAAVLLGASPASAATTATLSGTGRLTVNGTAAGETIVVRAVNSSTIGVGTRTFPAGAVRSIQVNGLGGNDTIRIDDARLAFTTNRPTTIDGGAGNDTIRGGKGRETLRGGGDADTVTGLRGNDVVDLGAGADTAVWNVGHGIDQVNGGTGADTQRSVGTSGPNAFTLSKQTTRARIAAAGGSASTLGVEVLDVAALAGNDSLVTGFLDGLGLTQVDLDLGLGTDPVTINGTAAFDEVQVADLSPGQRFLGNVAGNAPTNLLGSESLAINTGGTADQVTIVPGGAPITLDAGGSTDDELVLLGTNSLDDWEVAGDGPDLDITSNGFPRVAALGVEELLAIPDAGSDAVTFEGLGTTTLTEVHVRLSPFISTGGDASPDLVEVIGTGNPDVLQAAVTNGNVEVSGLTPPVSIEDSEAAGDRLVVEGSGGNDTLSGTVGLAAEMQLTLDGGIGNDTLNGGNGADTVVGDVGNDTVDGNGGNDTALVGDGNDTFVWDPGDGSDVVEGQAGTDTLLFNGSAGAEIFTASSNGGRMLFTRNVGNIIMDTDDVELLTVNALGGTDTATVNDLVATDVTRVDVNLGVNGVGDAAVDAVAMNGTIADNVFQITGFGAGTFAVRQPEVDVVVSNGELANDDVTINAAGGNDGIFSSTSGTSFAGFTVNAGADADFVVGTAGGDVLNGDGGNDRIFGEAGGDTINCGSETDTADGGSGTDSQSNCETITGIP